MWSREEKEEERGGLGRGGGGWGVMNRVLHSGLHHLVHKRGCMKCKTVLWNQML